MIAFCEKEVYVVYENDITSNSLFLFFIDKSHTTNIILVKNDEDQFVGIITYERLLYSKDNLVQKQFLTVGNNIWEAAKEIFKEDEHIIYIPVYDKNSELVYFCYKADILNEDRVDAVMDELYCNNEMLFINELFPNIQAVEIFELNELSYKFYNILLKRGIPTVVHGETWRIILDIETEEVICPSFAKIKIYSEGNQFMLTEKDFNSRKRFFIPYYWSFIFDIGNINRIRLENEIKHNFESIGKKIYICRIPHYGELKEHSIEEQYRQQKDLHIENRNLNSKDPIVRDQFYKIYDLEYEEVLENIYEKNSPANQGANSTTKNNKNYGVGKNIIYLIGPCIVNGYGSLPEKQILNYLYRYVNHLDYKVVGISILEEQGINLKEMVSSLSIRDKDIVIFLGQGYQSLCNEFGIVDNIDVSLKPLFDSRPKNEIWFTNIPIHSTGVANKAIAKEIYTKIIQTEIDKMDFSQDAICIQRGSVNISNKEKIDLQEYLNNMQKHSFPRSEDSTIGAIVMNCNPLTLGHMYLIDYSRKRVDYLYIFIVEEDRSFFSFKDRYSLVEKAVADMDNVHVVPSGQFILSNKTLPSYFNKDNVQEQAIDASEDIGIFVEYIAPALNIKVRFVGEEPLDNITNQYNIEMKRTLTDYQLQLVEIPRKEINGEVISASRVRKLLKNKNLEEIRKLVPEVTFQYLSRLV